LDKIERADVMPPDIAEELSAGYPPRKIPTPTGGCNFVCFYLTIAQIENVHLVNPLGYRDERTVLLDVQGHEYESVSAAVRGIRFLDPHDITGPKEVVEGATGFLVFEVPKHCIPARLSFVYSFKETWEEKYAKRGQIDIYLSPISIQSKIQSKIDAAKPGDTIIIKDGIYNANIKVNKRLTIRSENGSSNCIVQAINPKAPVFEVTADYVNISGFMVKGADTGTRFFHADYCNISNNNFLYNDVGVYLSGSNSSSISNNTCSNNNGDGISLSRSSNNTISGNNVSNNGDGISLSRSSNNTISGNNVSNNRYDGIDLYSSSNNTITSNNVSNNNGVGISLSSSSNNKIYLNNFINNTDSVDSYKSTNIWNLPLEITYTYDGTTYKSYLGNYWDDYGGTDAEGDGIGDTHYSIDGNNDNYPLMEPLENYFA
jgi:parallel beta-helix repeat protein